MSQGFIAHNVVLSFINYFENVFLYRNIIDFKDFVLKLVYFYLTMYVSSNNNISFNT